MCEESLMFVFFVHRIERDFIVTKTRKGKLCLLRGQFKYRKARETRGGFIVWRYGIFSALCMCKVLI